MDKQIHYSRLLAFADFLDGQNDTWERKVKNCDIRDWEGKTYSITRVQVILGIFDFIPDVFESWYFEHVSRDPVLEGNELIKSTIDSVYEFFGLETIDFCQLFAMRSQNIEYGGIVLDENSTLKDIAQNIVNYVGKKRYNEQ